MTLVPVPRTEDFLMRILVLAAVAIAAAAAASPALAATGQCYDAYGRPVGGPFDTFNPNRAFIDSVTARGGRCQVYDRQGAYPPPAYAPGYPSYYQYRMGPNDPGGRHT